MSRGPTSVEQDGKKVEPDGQKKQNLIERGLHAVDRA